MVAATEKSKTFFTASTITTETNQDKVQVTEETVYNQEKRATESRATSVELGDMMTKLEQIDKKLKCNDEECQELKKELQHNKNENLDNNYVLARATEKSYNKWRTKWRRPTKNQRKMSKKTWRK